MSKNYRQCPHCGGRTVERTCELCGRTTISTNVSYEDIEPKNNLDNSSYTSQSNQEEPKEGHLQKMMREGRFYQKQPSLNKSPKGVVISIIIGVLVIVLPLVVSAVQDQIEENEYSRSYDNINEQYDYFKDYLVTVRDETPLTCEIDEVEKEWIYVKNTTPYFFESDVEVETIAGKDKSSIYLGSPYTTESNVVSSDAQSCEVIYTKYQNLNIYESDIAYEVIYDDAYTETILLQEDISEEDMEQLLKRIYAIHIVTFNTFDDSLKILIDNKQAYLVEFNYDDPTIFVHNSNNNQKTVISMDIL